MAPPLDRHDLHDHPWKRRSGLSFSALRLPRRSRRATYLCWAMIIFLIYLVLNSVTSWSHIPNPAGLHRPKEVIPIKFTALFNSLPHTKGGTRSLNRNVLFAAESLEAASKLAGIACEMADFRKSNVHFAFVGRDYMDIELFKELNGITNEVGGCKVMFHDARAESANRMTEDRLKIATKTGLRHLHEFIHPQIMLLSVDHEEEWFIETARQTTQQLQMQTIELPDNAANDLRWITRLDSGSIGGTYISYVNATSSRKKQWLISTLNSPAWNKPSFEIMIHADKHSGNLERLLKSLELAFYPTGHRPKSLTIILDPSAPLHAFTKSFLSDYSFPSSTRTFIRRPLLPALTTKETAMRFVESFYPVNDSTFLLILDTNVELSKWYFHYLLFTTLQYKYSIYKHTTNSLYGISLVEPTSFLNGTNPFPVPLGKSPFLYPVPSSNAALYFPKHWSEFHSFFSKNLQFPILEATATNKTGLISLTISKEVAESWSTPFISLIRARGYAMLYPSFPRDTLAILHTEQPSYTRSKYGFEKTLMDKNNLLNGLPDEDLPIYNRIPLLDWQGRPTLWDKLELDAFQYRRAISSCPDVSVPNYNFDAGDLFCDPKGDRLE